MSVVEAGAAGLMRQRLLQLILFLQRAAPMHLLVAGLFLLTSAGLTLAADDPRQGDIQSLRLGQRASDLPTDPYADYACGSNGGPPRALLSGWTDFAKCPREAATGLHEVYFRYDDEYEYVARAYEDEASIARYSGTTLGGTAVILSVLFDDSGIAKGMRIVTDPRTTLDDRRTAYLLGTALKARYDDEGWACVDQPAANGESPIGPVFIKRHCEKDYNDDRHLSLDIHFFRRPGETGISRETGQLTSGDFESSTRLDITSLDAVPKH